MSKAIGITLHYDDGTTTKHGIAEVVLALTSKGGGAAKYTYINADACPVHGPWLARPAGTTKDGRDYPAFWTCDVEKGDPRCTNKPSRDWIETHPPDRASASQDFDYLPF